MRIKRRVDEENWAIIVSDVRENGGRERRAENK